MWHICWPQTCQHVQNFPITFDAPFGSVPHVIVALNGLDIDHTRNSRLRVEAVNVRSDGFTIKITTWADTNLYAAGASWTACAQAQGCGV